MFLTDAILETITKKPASSSQLRVLFGKYNKNTIRRAIGDLARDGKIEKVVETRTDPTWKLKDPDKAVVIKQNARPSFQGVKSAPPTARPHGSTSFFTF